MGGGVLNEWEQPTRLILAMEAAEESGDWDPATESWDAYVERVRP